MTDRQVPDRQTPDRRRSAHDSSLGRAASAAEGDLSLPKPPGVIRRFWARHPWWTDSLIAAVYVLPAFIGSVSVAVLSPTVNGHALVAVTGPILAAGSGAAVLFRRRAPLWALAVTTVCTFVTMSSQRGYLAFGVCLTLYAVAVYRSNRAAWIGLACAAAAVAAGAFLPFPQLLGFNEASQPVATWAVFMLLAVLIGVNIGNRKRYLQALIDRAAQLARERDQQAQLATAAERARIAREMHDIVSHSLTVMVSLADGSAALASVDPERATDAMRQVAETGRHALTDMRRMLDVLAEPAPASKPALAQEQEQAQELAQEQRPADVEAPTGAALEPQPRASDIAELIQRFRSAGLPARLSVTGAAPDDPGLQLTVYRVVQESLTNVLRHASGAAHVEVTVTYQPDAVRIRIDDSGVARAPVSDTTSHTATHGAGRGLVGMRERVALHRGTLESGPRPSGGWRVAVTLHPLENGEST
ncbi:sensor histidine kinase [Rathayibacter soli]|uniref:sensor histidine kinase n=1 Tax=Rathayibacter soli TaxID=3144168 RepID=UPI0027E4DE50|nr:histidine kinase [Glaciibacter superstes]